MRKVFNGSKKNETIEGTGKADEIYGNDGNDKLIGHTGDDYLDGGKGVDVLFGGQNFDTLKGGKGDDRFAFNSLLEADADHILDFKHSEDRIVLDHHVYDEYRKPGPLAADNFVLGAAALDENDHVIYNQETGQLFYDEDGNGEGAAILLATLDNHAGLTAADVFIF